MGVLYKLTAPSGKSYIGITSFDVSRRVDEHARAAAKGVDTALYAAIRKHGLLAFSTEILGHSESWPELCEMEKVAILEHGTYAPSGYNMTEGGDGVIGIPPESKRRHREKSAKAATRAWATSEMRNRRAAVFATDGFKERHRQATAAGTRRAYKNEAVRQALRNSRKDPKYRARVSASMTERWKDPVYRVSQVTKRRRRQPRTEESKRLQAQKMRDLIAARKAAGTYWM